MLLCVLWTELAVFFRYNKYFFYYWNEIHFLRLSEVIQLINRETPKKKYKHTAALYPLFIASKPFSFSYSVFIVFLHTSNDVAKIAADL